jgi:hypothetical protein
MFYRKVIFIIFFIFIIGRIVIAGRTVITQPQTNVGIIKNNKGNALFSGEDLQYLTNTGEPAIPYRLIKVLLPPNTDLSSIQVSMTNMKYEEVDQEWNVEPVPPVALRRGQEVILLYPDEKTIVNGKDVDIYTNENPFPKNPVGEIHTGMMRKWRLVDIPVALFQYYPVSKKLFRLNSSQLVVEYTRNPGPPIFPPNQNIYNDHVAEARVQALAVNFHEQVSEYQQMEEEQIITQSGNGYVIVTTNSIVAASSKLTDFVNSKENKGFSVQTVTEDTWGGGTGDAAAENIRNWLINNYVAMSIEYVLLIGNPHPYSGDVPMKMLWPRNNDASYKEAPSDYYYADLTGNWDLDSDGYYGEWGDDFGAGGVDRNWDVLVGRIPYYDNMADLDSILAKIISYENASSASATWRKNVLLPMKPQDGSTPGYQLGEEIKNDVIIPKGDWGYHRVYDGEYSLIPPPETTPCTISNVQSAWNGSQFGCTLWWTHGDSTSAIDVMDISDAVTLDDDYPGFIFQCSCLNSYPEVSYNLGYTILKNGGISTVSATRVSWYMSGQTSFAGGCTNSSMAFEYAKRLITNEMTCGNALNDLKQVIEPWHQVFWMNYVIFNIYGDPSLGPFVFGSQSSGNVLISLKLWLEGAYQAGGTMSSVLNSNILKTSPYSDARTIESVPSGVIDWISVELRTSPSDTAVSQRSFFIKSNGMVVDTDGTTTDLSMPDVSDGSYYIVIKHRSHLSIMSAGSVELNSSSSTSYDFSVNSNKYYGTNGAKQVETDIWGMWTGDINQDGDVTTMDYTAWYNAARSGNSGYIDADINMDTQVTTMDYVKWYNNAKTGVSSGVP